MTNQVNHLFNIKKSRYKRVADIRFCAEENFNWRYVEVIKIRTVDK